MFLILNLCLLHLSLPVSSYFVWTSPVDVGSHIPSPINYPVDELAKLTWITNTTSYTIGLGQSYVKGCGYFCPDSTIVTIYNKTEAMPETNGFSWNISISDLINVTTSTFWLFCSEGEDLNDTGLPSSELFNITNEKAVTDVSTASPTSSSPATASPLPTSNSASPSSSTTPLPDSPAQSATKAKGSSGHENLYVGIIVGLGSLLFLVLGFLAWYFRKNNKNLKSTLPQSIPTSTTILHDDTTSSSGLLQASAQSEIPNRFNNRPAEYELPGKDNEVSTGRANLAMERRYMI